mgnify:FL=1|tara:strand:- start:830 stop:1153 length:324 start_codon:yes stop_codon:yes gene_type:complete
MRDPTFPETHYTSDAQIAQSDARPSPPFLYVQGVYAAQMLAAPEWAHGFYYKDNYKSTKESRGWQNWYVAPPINIPMCITLFYVPPLDFWVTTNIPHPHPRSPSSIV